MNTDRAQLESLGAALQPSLYRHLKSGGVYEIVLECKNEKDLEPTIVYRNKNTGEKWARPKKEFFDGRFEHISVLEYLRGRIDNLSEKFDRYEERFQKHDGL